MAIFHLTSLPFEKSKAQLPNVNICFQAGDDTHCRPSAAGAPQIYLLAKVPLELPRFSWGKKIEYGGNSQQNKT